MSKHKDKDKEKKKEFPRVPEADSSGGYKFTDSKEEVEAQRGLIWDVFKQVAANVTQRKNLINIALPVRLFEPRSYLERVTDSWCLAPVFLQKASACADPLERLKYVITFAIGGLHNTCTQKKPFNPILGETFEGRYSDGTLVYCEQTSHHPPVTSWQVFGPNNSYKFYGFGEWTASFHVNSITGAQKGVTFVEFPDGTKIQYILPEISVKGILFGNRIMEYLGEIWFKDVTHNLMAIIKIPPASEGYFSWWGSGSVPSDYLKGEIFKYTDDNDGESFKPKGEKALSQIAGSWLGCVDFDGKTYWSINDGIKVHKVEQVDHPLPSDSRFRQDLVALKQGKMDDAASSKTILENNQRSDAKLRAARRPHP